MITQPYRITRGFTLIEILIVGVLISLFAGLAIFNVQETYRSNLRKATIGEVRQLGTALALANQDLGVFPKIGLLMYSKTQMQAEGYRLTGNEDFWFANLDAFRNEPGFGPVAFRVKQAWTQTPYFGASQSRNTVSGGGIVTMDYGSVSGTPVELDWPSDPWGNPYVFYSLNINVQSGQRSFVEQATEAGNYWVGAVSYGPNGVPGADGNALTEALFIPTPDRNRFQALQSSQFDQTRADAIDKILAPESDDVIFPF